MTTVQLDFRPKQNRPIASARELDPAIAAGTATGPRRGMLDAAYAGLAQPFKGLSTDGTLEPGLYKLGPTGVSTAPVRDAARELLALLTAEERTAISFPLDAEEWRQWSNVHPFLMRHGVCLDYMAPAARQAALGLLEATLSAAGFQEARDIMRLNLTIGEVTNRLGPEYREYGEWLYWVSIMGDPTSDGPWGWQIDGHHLNLSVFVLGDQMVFTPYFTGSEPIFAPMGTYAGVRVFEKQESRGLALMQALDAGQRAKALLHEGLPGEMFAGAFRDNYEMRYEGVSFDEMNAGQRELLNSVIETYVHNARDGHSDLWLAEVKAQLPRTHFAWVGACDDEAVFYYRVHSPVILIEFDHQRGVALDSDVPTRNHIHTIVRTPNGNDYGKDLLRQHYERHHR